MFKVPLRGGSLVPRPSRQAIGGDGFISRTVSDLSFAEPPRATSATPAEFGSRSMCPPGHAEWEIPRLLRGSMAPYQLRMARDGSVLAAIARHGNLGSRHPQAAATLRALK